MLCVCFVRAGNSHAAVVLAFKHRVIIIEYSCELACMQPSSNRTKMYPEQCLDQDKICKDLYVWISKGSKLLMLSWNSNQVWSGQGFVLLKLWLISQVCLEELLLICDEAPSIFQTWFHIGGEKIRRKITERDLLISLHSSWMTQISTLKIWLVHHANLQQTAVFDPSWNFNGFRPSLRNQSASLLYGYRGGKYEGEKRPPQAALRKHWRRNYCES